MYSFADFLDTLFKVVIIPAIPVVLYYIRAWVVSIVEKKTADMKSERQRTLINSAVKSVFAVVDATSQTYVDNIKNEGLFDEAAQKKAFDMAKSEALRLITIESHNAIKEAYGNVDIWLNNTIEQFVAAKKTGTEADVLAALTL